MKLNRMIAMCAVVTALVLSVGNVFAQDDTGGPGGPGGPDGPSGPEGPGGPGGPGDIRPGRPEGGNFDPAQMQQHMMQNIQNQLGFTNETDWSAVQPLVQKILDNQRALRGNMRRLFARGGPGATNQPSDPVADALQHAIDNAAPKDQVKDLLTKYQASQKEKQNVLTTAQDNLRAVLTVKQEAQATLMGLLN
jgi:hypothetical protein